MIAHADAELPDELPLTPVVFHILLALADEARDDFGIMKEIETLSEGHFELGAGRLHSNLKEMEQASLLVALPLEPPATGIGRPRRTYRLTEHGAELLRAEVHRLGTLLRRAALKEIHPVTTHG